MNNQNEEYRLWEVSGEISFRTLAWAKTKKEAEDSVDFDDFDQNDWYVNTRPLSDEMVVQIKSGYADLSMDDYPYCSDIMKEATLKECIEVIKERLEISQKEERVKNNGQIPLVLDFDSTITTKEEAHEYVRQEYEKRLKENRESD